MPSNTLRIPDECGTFVAHSALPKSLGSGQEFRGINVLLLATSRFSSRYWVTYDEALRRGGHVRQGQRATPVIDWKWRTQEEMRKLAERTQGNIAACVPFGRCVFNLDQVEGLDRPTDDVAPDHDRRLALADALLTTMPDRPQIEHQHLQTPHYGPLRDCVTLPHLSQFESAEAYYAVLFQELIRASGQGSISLALARQTTLDLTPPPGDRGQPVTPSTSRPPCRRHRNASRRSASGWPAAGGASPQRAKIRVNSDRHPAPTNARKIPSFPQPPLPPPTPDAPSVLTRMPNFIA